MSEEIKKPFEFSADGKVLKEEHEDKTTCYKLDELFNLSENMTEISRDEYDRIFRHARHSMDEVKH